MQAIRRLPGSDRKVLYLTFDDGPHRGSTEAVLELLAKHQILATFFVIAEQAQQEPKLLRQIHTAGHAIGNHSLDHGYSRFFRGKAALREWIELAESSLSELIGEPTVGFRPPAGVLTPKLYQVLQDINMPLVLWKIRFFDAVLPWTSAKALKSLKRTQSGDIILLHDRQKPARLAAFIQTLDGYISAAKLGGFEFEVLTRDRLNAIPTEINNKTEIIDIQ